MKRVTLAMLLLMLFSTAPLFADSVSLLVDSGNDQGGSALFAGSSLAMQFTLNQTTDITSVDALIDYPSRGSQGVWNLSIASAPGGGTTFWSSGPQSFGGDYTTDFLLSAGTYDLILSGISCSPPDCVTGIAAEWEYFSQPNYSLTGGSIQNGFYQNGSHTFLVGALGMDIEGSTVPEPGTIVLLGSGILALAGLPRLRKRLTSPANLHE